ncbi:RNA-binding protein 44 isoform X2 [Pungitius pungitius]|uniref:RNA-binding protein 44 isoform X2 n=1 Tax=Pungitius pungitius TaxID=134920 RepID=UPI002E12852C
MAAFHTDWPLWSPYNYAAKNVRKFLLDRSVFDLVDVHKVLSLTDPKLLGWYLNLSLEDRKDIQDGGGFQRFLLRHPALELSQHHVHVKRNVSRVVPAQPTITCNRSIMQGETYFRSDWERFPNNMRETFNQLCYNSSDGSQMHQTAFNCTTRQEPNQQMSCTVRASCQLSERRPSWQTSSKDPTPPPGVFLDTDLQGHRQGGQPELRSCTTASQVNRCDRAYAEVSLLQSEGPTGDEDLSPEYYSFNSIQMDATDYSERSLLQPVELEQNISPVDPVEEGSIEEGPRGHMLQGNDIAEGDGEAGASFGDQSDKFHSIMVSDESILVCLTSADVRTFNATHPESEAPKPDQSVTTTHAAEHHSPQRPRVTTCDIMVGTEVEPHTSAVGNTEDPPTADKHVNTEVYMSDLDYVAEEFAKLQKVQEQQRGHKKERQSCECDGMQRAQRAELGLLALQYVMCKQHCWRLYHTASEGGQLAPMKKNNPSAEFASILQKLECDYNRMRDEMLAGVPLEELKPLSVDLKQIKSHASYNPAKIISEVLGNVPSGSEEGRPNDGSPTCSQSAHRKENSAAERALTIVLKDGDAPINAHEQEEKHTTAAVPEGGPCEAGPCEAWFDAEENPHSSVVAQPGQEPTGGVGQETLESAGEEVDSELLCVSNLPSNTTESDVMLWFEKHQPSEVSISALKTDFRVAIVMVSGPQSAAAAVRELHGCCVQGRTLHVEHIKRAIGGRRASVGGPHSANGPETSPTEREPMSQPPGASVGDGKVVAPPAGKGASVPRHFDPMGSFDTLMAELTQRHPDAGRPRIVDALMELKAERQGPLSGLPLSAIREMTSALLTRSERATES